MVLSDAINAVASLIRSPETDAVESDASSAETDGFKTLAKDVSAESDATVALAENSDPAVDENGACENDAMPNIYSSAGSGVLPSANHVKYSW